MWKPGTRVELVREWSGPRGPVWAPSPLGSLGTVVDSPIHPANAATGADFSVVVDGFDYAPYAPWCCHDARSVCWRPLDQNDPAAESWAQIKRELGNPQKVTP